ncbi:MAG: macro domain-containing protein [Candidatus Eisenbacteria bacterium]
MTFHVVNSRIGWALPKKAPQEGEALVLPANDHLWMGAGPGLEIKKAHGNEIELEAVRLGPVPLGGVAVTPGGPTGFTHLFHAVVSGQDLKWVEGAGEKAVAAVLAEAERRKIGSLVFHPLFRGMHADKMAAAKEFLGAFLPVLEAGSAVKEITVLTEDDAEWKLFQDLFLQLLTRA